MELMMQKPWFEKHRPKVVEDVVFDSQQNEDKIKQFIKDGYIQGNIISYGPGGTGKTTTNKVLLHSIVKEKNDYFTLNKSVTKIDELISWLKEKGGSSRQRIVICEEFDRLSSAAQTALKDGLMEKYTPRVAYIVTTNKIESIDSALLQRFNIKLNLTKYNPEKMFVRIKNILNKESIKFDEKEVWQIVNTFVEKGMRELLNNMQNGSINGEFKLSNLSTMISSTGVEDVIISYIKYYIQYINSLVDLEVLYNICLMPQKDPSLSVYYNQMLDYMDADPSINYDYIYKTLIVDQDINLAVKKIFQQYYQQLNIIPMKSIHLQSCLYEVFSTLYFIKGGEKNLLLK